MKELLQAKEIVMEGRDLLLVKSLDGRLVDIIDLGSLELNLEEYFELVEAMERGIM